MVHDRLTQKHVDSGGEVEPHALIQSACLLLERTVSADAQACL